MKAPILALSDLHFHNYKAHSTLIEGVNSRLLDIERVWNQALGIAETHECSSILIAGDFFEIRGSIRPSVFNRVTALVAAAVQRGIDIGAIAGNHDMEHFEAGESAIDSWSHIRDHARGTRCTILNGADPVAIGGWRVAGIPYMHSIARFKEAFQRTAELEPEVILVHQGVDDFDKAGRYPETGLSASWLEDHCSAWVLCGHYHNPARLGRVINVGAPAQHRFSDEGTERGCWVVDALKATFFKLRSPNFHTIASLAAADEATCRGNFIKIRTKSVEQASKIRKRAEACGALSVVIEIEREFKTAHEKTVRLSTPREMLCDYLDIVDKYRKKRESILELFDRICTDAL